VAGLVNLVGHFVRAGLGEEFRKRLRVYSTSSALPYTRFHPPLPLQNALLDRYAPEQLSKYVSLHLSEFSGEELEISPKFLLATVPPMEVAMNDGWISFNMLAVVKESFWVSAVGG